MGLVGHMTIGVGTEGASASRVSGLGKRLASALVLLPVFVWIVVGAPAWVFGAMVVLVAARGQWELTGMFERAGVRTWRPLALCAGIAVTASFAAPRLTAPTFTLALLTVLAASLRCGPGRTLAWEPLGVAVLGIAYVNWLLGHAIRLRDLEAGVAWVLLLVAVTWVGETAAYVAGSLVGRRKLAPIVSPNKTVEGAVAQLVASVAASLVVRASFFPDLALGHAIAVGALLGVAGQVGDLAESVLKRSVGTKDTAQLIPGHGGILDRIDGLLFNAPVLFYYAAWARALPS